MALLEIVDENDVVVGTAERSEIHAKGLRHREVHVWLVTMAGEVVFQRRSMTKDTYPNFLDASAGGHVEVGQSYNEAALMEAEEELGLNIDLADLVELGKLKLGSFDAERQAYNNVFRMMYGCVFEGDVSSLKIEEGDGAGFEAIHIDEVIGRTTPKLKEMVPNMLTEPYLSIWPKIKAMVGK